MVDYVKLAKTALRLIDENGRDVLFTVNSDAPLVAARPWEGIDPAGDDAFTVKAVVIPYELEEVDGKLVRAGDSRMFVAANTVTTKDMKSVDKALDRSELWRVVAVNEITPGPTDVLFELRLRK